MASATTGMISRIKQNVSRCPRRWAMLMMLPKPAGTAAVSDELGQHDVAERQAEQQPQRIEDARHRQRHQHLQDDLPARCAERVGRVDVAAADVGNGRAVSIMTNATPAMKMNITFCISPMPKNANVSGISAAMGMLRPKTFSGAREGVDPGKAAAQDAQRNRRPRPPARSRAPRAAG